eukprot:2592845-Amphidinium_carterae.1
MERLRALKEKESAGKEKKVTNKADNIEVRHYVHQVQCRSLDAAESLTFPTQTGTKGWNMP